MIQGPQTPQALFQQAVAAFQSGNLVQAEAVCAQCQLRFPAFSEAFHMHGVICGQTNRPDMGIQLLTKADTLAPGNPAILANLGEALRRARRYPEAVSALQRAVTLQPQMAPGWLNLALAHANAAQHAQGIQALRAGLKHLPQNPQLRFNLGTMLHDFGLIKDALVEFQEAV